MTITKRALITVVVCFRIRAADLGPDLLSAARKGQAERVAEFLGKGAPLEAKDKNGRTPLMLAAQHGHAEVARLLLAKGAETGARDRQGWTAFGLALFSSSGAHDEVLRILPQPPRLRLAVDAR